MRTFLVITFVVVLVALYWFGESDKPGHAIAYKILYVVLLWLIAFMGVFIK